MRRGHGETKYLYSLSAACSWPPGVTEGQQGVAPGSVSTHLGDDPAPPSTPGHLIILLGRDSLSRLQLRVLHLRPLEKVLTKKTEKISNQQPITKNTNKGTTHNGERVDVLEKLLHLGKIII